MASAWSSSHRYNHGAAHPFDATALVGNVIIHYWIIGRFMPIHMADRRAKVALKLFENLRQTNQGYVATLLKSKGSLIEQLCATQGSSRTYSPPRDCKGKSVKPKTDGSSVKEEDSPSEQS
jgi:hypothetical protein